MPIQVQVGELSRDFRPWRRQDGRVFTTPFALDVETTAIVGHEVPEYVLGGACDRERGFFLTPGAVHDFLAAHADTQLIFHHCPFGHTCQGKDQSTLEACAERHLNVSLPKAVLDDAGNDIRTSWGRWKGRPPREVPAVYLEYLGKDVLCTYGCWPPGLEVCMEAAGGDQHGKALLPGGECRVNRSPGDIHRGDGVVGKRVTSTW